MWKSALILLGAQIACWFSLIFFFCLDACLPSAKVAFMVKILIILWRTCIWLVTFNVCTALLGIFLSVPVSSSLLKAYGLFLVLACIYCC
jgi:hypothetical protein